MNEVTLHRGRHPHLAVVDTFFDGQHLTEAVVSHRRSHGIAYSPACLGYMPSR